MPKTRKNIKTRKDKTSKTRDLEDLVEEDLDLDIESESETGSETDSGSDSDSESDSESEPSMSKELNKMINETMDSDLTMPAIGIGLLAIIGFALYKGANV
jgi:hypothetical protein